MVRTAKETSCLSIAVALSAKGIDFPIIRDREGGIDEELSPQEARLSYMHVIVLAVKTTVSKFLLGKVFFENRL